MNAFRMLRILILPALLIVSACAHHQKIPPETPHFVFAADSDRNELVSRYAPVFLAYDYNTEYNRIGRPSARYDEQGKEQVYVDSRHPVIYFLKRNFSTGSGSYTNLIYRVHFREVPFSLIPFNLTAGKNVGILVVITLDSRQKPVLVITVGTCGCYNAIVPTSFLPHEALPLEWEERPQSVYGEILPGQLDYESRNNPKLLVHLRPGVNRIMDLEIVGAEKLEDARRFTVVKAPLKPAMDLEQIPLGSGFTSFYYQEGAQKGHVKGSAKPFESILLSLPSLDFFVGADKVYGDRRETGNPFYTSLKPWNRTASDMGDFAGYLKFWGWRL